VRLLVDTGAWYSMVPRRFLQRLGVRPQWRETLVVADGRPMERYLAEVVIHYRGMSRTTPVVFAERGDATVLGAYTLEGLTLEYDPRTGRLTQMKVIPMYAGTAETAVSAWRGPPRWRSTEASSVPSGLLRQSTPFPGRV